MSTLLIYGATGYTGRMAAERAKVLGLNFEIAGRSQQRLAALAAQLDVPYRVFDTDAVIETFLSGISVLLNFAGPFAQTAEPLMRASIKAGVDYLDITAEINVYRLAEKLGDQAASSKVMLLPGVGWDVVPTDSLAVQVARRVEEPLALSIALQVPGSMSRGSAMSVSEIIGAGLLARVDGELIATPDATPRHFDFGQGPVLCVPLSFGDLVTAWHSTGIPNIAMFVHIVGNAFPEGDLSQLPDGPTAEQRDANRARAVVEVMGGDGTIARSVIETVNGYSYTPLGAVEAARRVLNGERQPGFATPAKVFGDGFAQSIPGTVITNF
ncbi:saccharopine dehydrogenase NADP-binding domain-containing protein [Pseudomonas sp. 10B1]|uniref:saccharopine dehydrogenase family protein n=1 Tax=unclassified Pseudomonas TaxID=196821 RepID=UPI002B2372BA|nr:MULTISPECIES: saccharopine dehydrogenase NADP-binding domain-containing protein [unclassified Pseudomonas]MEA9992922.1 saccharopine dehydrogenase NADP-binding domain-containing protein [Pseudomonas sp. AA4]MEB0089097.1 saccharopine dehydrogenase NADP-binding domain-containing protein [Pseudomonas sp. RTI1]MEB0125700.1 saccharopine dehydrogenase NADP-binding domain-containing protein [Pseudomonas sp. CCC1.2]MEB0151507.1 saccharopine dehydrogenase NADP-binding domain-containing protein [Pseudo